MNSPKGIVFLKSIDASVISKTTEKFFEMMDNIVEEKTTKLQTTKTMSFKLSLIMQQTTKLLVKC